MAEKKSSKATVKADEPKPPIPEPCSRTIEELLTDKTFDPEARVRMRLAAISASGPLGQHPPLDLVTLDGKPVVLKACPTCGREMED